MNFDCLNLAVLIVFFQILFEAFPISSSGHVVLLEKILRKFGVFSSVQLPKYFDHFLHGPTVLVILLAFWNSWYFPFSRLIKSLFNIKLFTRWSYKNLRKIFFKLFGYLCISTFVAAVFWFAKDIWFEKQIWFASNTTLLVGFSVTMFFLFLLYLKNCEMEQYQTLTFKKAIILSFVQGASQLLFGCSRFASFYVTARLLNLSPRRAFECTFLFELPLILPAFFLGAFKLIKQPGWQNLFTLQMNLVFLFSTILSYFALLWMRKLAIKKKLWMFVFYMPIPILLVIWLIYS